MDNLGSILLIMFGMFVAFYMVKKSIINIRRKNIDSFHFPTSLAKRVKYVYPHLSASDSRLVIDGLREYFHVCNMAGKRMVSMPSQAVDVAWHEFILFTKSYASFCQSAFGRFLHHTPAEEMSSPKIAQRGIKTAWKFSCQRAHIDPLHADALPLLFAIDRQLKIPDGFKYSLNCDAEKGYGFCASHIGCGSGCTGGCASDSSGCGSGCGGD